MACDFSSSRDPGTAVRVAAHSVAVVSLILDEALKDPKVKGASSGGDAGSGLCTGGV